MKEKEEKEEDNCPTLRNTSAYSKSFDTFFMEGLKNSYNINIEEKKKSFLNYNLENLKEIELFSKIKCPEKNCFSNCIISLDPIFFDVNYDCGQHKNKIDLIEYAINEKGKKDKEICHNCEETYEILKKNNKKLYKCFCEQNYCETCKEQHLNKEKNKLKIHNMVEYKDKDYLCCCSNEYKKFIEYCLTCKKNLCIICNAKHIEHKKVQFSNLEKMDKELLRKKIEEQKMKIVKFNEVIDNWIKRTQKIILLIKKQLELYIKINVIIFNKYKINKLFYEEIKNIQNITFDFSENFLSLLNSENDIKKQNKIICKILNEYIQSKKSKKSNKKIKNIKLKEKIQTNGTVKNICELKKEKLLIVNAINKYSQEEISIFKKEDNSNQNNSEHIQFKFCFNTIEYGKISDLIELKNGNLLIVKNQEFKIMEILMNQSLIKKIQAKKVELENEYFKEIKELLNGYLISISYFDDEFLDNRVICWRKNLINGNYENNIIIRTYEKPLSILEINKYIFMVYFSGYTLSQFNSQTFKRHEILSIQTKKEFQLMVKVGEDGILFIYEKALILFNLKNLIYNVVAIKYNINCICKIDNSNNYFLSSITKNGIYGLIIFYINLEENRIYRIKKIFIENAHSSKINSIYKLYNDNNIITGSDDNNIKVWETN